MKKIMIGVGMTALALTIGCANGSWHPYDHTPHGVVVEQGRRYVVVKTPAGVKTRYGLTKARARRCPALSAWPGCVR